MAMAEGLGRILIVDDEQPVLDVLGEYFSTQGYSVDTASNGSDALVAARRARPDLVLLDVRMPGMDGMEVLRRLHAADQALAIIMVTANEDVALARETLKSGAFDYVAKPFDFSYLDRAVSAALVHADSAVAGAEAPTPGRDDPWTRLVFAVFRVVREMSGAGRASTGQHLETAALAAAREAQAGRAQAATSYLDQIGLLLGIAAELGDLSAAGRSSIDGALTAVRTGRASR